MNYEGSYRDRGIKSRHPDVNYQDACLPYLLKSNSKL